MTAKDFKEIPLDKLKPNPWNQRDAEDYRGEKFDGLVASIRKSGVLQPILVRPLKKDSFEIIFGECRYRASCEVAKANGGLKKGTIPAMVRNMTDDEAFDACVVENLHRKDLTPFQEARTFKAYVERYKGKDRKKDIVQDLSERTSKGAQYIRRRIAILALPAEVLKAWDKGLITIGHCEQLTRLTDKKQILEYLDSCTKQWNPMTVSELRDQIDSEAVPMKNVWFDLAEAGCNTCQKNTDVQRELLFGDEMEAKKQSSCLDPTCYENHQTDVLKTDWDRKFKKKWGTNGFRFERAIHGEFGRFNGKKGSMHKDIADKCLLCENFVTVLWSSGKPAWEQACADMTCYRKLKSKPVQQPPQRSSGSSQPGLDAGGEPDETSTGSPTPEAPRVTWHGKHFREEFFQEVLPSWISNLDVDSDKCLRIVLAGILNSNLTALEYFRKMALTSTVPYRSGRYSFEPADWKFIEGMDCVALRTVLKALGGYIAMQTDKTSHETRCAIASHLGIDLARDWRITQSYLDKKTKAEILQFGEQLGIFADPKAELFLKATLGKRKFSALKKAELDRVILESGVDLAGKVPAEILDMGPQRDLDDSEDDDDCMAYVNCPHFDECEHIGQKCKHQWNEGDEPLCCFECDDLEGCDQRCQLYGIRTCRECGCTEEYGCDGGCSWVEDDLCSACQDKEA